MSEKILSAEEFEREMRLLAMDRTIEAAFRREERIVNYYRALLSEREQMDSKYTNCAKALALMTHCVQDIDDLTSMMLKDDPAVIAVRKVLDDYEKRLDNLATQEGAAQHG